MWMGLYGRLLATTCSALHSRYHTASESCHLRAVPCGCMHSSRNEHSVYSTLTCAMFHNSSHASSHSDLRVVVMPQLGWLVTSFSPWRPGCNPQGCPCEICGRQSCAGTSLVTVLVYLSIIILLILHNHSSSIIQGWYDRSTSSHSTNGPSQPRIIDLLLYVYYHVIHDYCENVFTHSYSSHVSE
jgi:hypothetical protein